jgi:hypothetical protein
MEITKKNWDECFPVFVEKITDPSLSFISFDCEMTGIEDSEGSCNQGSISERYQNMV